MEERGKPTVLLYYVALMLREVIEPSIKNPVGHAIQTFPARDRVCSDNRANRNSQYIISGKGGGCSTVTPRNRIQYSPGGL
jgi:hypothetical protein